MDTAKLIAAASLCLLLAACSTTMGNLCTAGPFIPDPGANQRWTRSEKEQAVTINKAGEDVCGWQAPVEG